jgi:flagellin FlaB
MIEKLIKRLQKWQEGITGLETAIILIAFVIVASVFAYVVLSAGLFSSQKAKEAVNAGLQSTMSTLEIKSSIIAKMEESLVTHLYFCVGIPAGSSPVDFSPPTTGNISSLIISYIDAEHLISSVNWSIEKLSKVNDDNLLDPNELFQVTVVMPTTGNVSVGPYHTFTLEIKPADGPVMCIERTVPGRVTQYTNLH